MQQDINDIVALKIAKEILSKNISPQSVIEVPNMPFAVVNDRHFKGEGVSLAVHDGLNFTFGDGDYFDRKGDTLDGCTAEFLSWIELEKKLQSVIETAQSGWQDISTAPRDKTAILIYQDRMIIEVWFSVPWGKFVRSETGGVYGIENPMYWMPLPLPPPDINHSPTTLQTQGLTENTATKTLITGNETSTNKTLEHGVFLKESNININKDIESNPSKNSCNDDLTLAWKWLSKAPHSEKCDIENSDKDHAKCICGKYSALGAMDNALNQLDTRSKLLAEKNKQFEQELKNEREDAMLSAFAAFALLACHQADDLPEEAAVLALKIEKNLLSALELDAVPAIFRTLERSIANNIKG